MRDHLSSFTLADMVSKAEGNGAKVPTVPDDLPVGVSRGMARSSAR